jgi:hypothetical protein
LLSSLFCAEDLFKTLNPGFPIFDLLFKVDFQVDNEEVQNALLKGYDGEYLSYDDLPSHAKAEALIPILVSSCLNLSSSMYKHVIQDIFGRLVFHARSALCGFYASCKGSNSELSLQAASYLHDRSMMNLFGVPEEALVCFLILTDFLRYHFDMVGWFSKKYRHLLSNDTD